LELEKLHVSNLQGFICDIPQFRALLLELDALEFHVQRLYEGTGRGVRLMGVSRVVQIPPIHSFPI